MTGIKKNKDRRRSLSIERLEQRTVLDARLVITEFVASNAQGLQDEEGDRTDWVEIYNAGDMGADLTGWSLTDDADGLDKWRFPEITLDAQHYLVVFASGKDRADSDSPLHTSFRLDVDGEYLALGRPDDSIASAYAFPSQHTDVSFGVPPDGIPDTPQITGGRYFANPTPGSENDDVSYAGKVQNVTVNIGRGFYDQNQEVVITTETTGATIAYTTDGSLPTANNGAQVAAPDADAVPRAELSIDATTTLRVAALKSDHLSSATETHTYLFVDDVIRQSPDGQAPDGWPTAPINGQQFNYGMDPDIVDDPDYAPLVQEALLDIPSFSIVTDVAHLFDPETGIFVNGEEARDDGRAFERPTSVELIQPDGSQGFQMNAGLRMRGGLSRRDDNPKHAFRLLFRAEYGDAKLQFPLFGDDGVVSFDNIDLRTAQAPSWSWCVPGAVATSGGCQFNTMVRDVFTRDSQGDMGQPYTRSHYYHLYLNGQYWGLFQTQERPEASYAESYFGGDKEDYDVIKVEAFPHQIAATDGNLDAWRRLWDEAIAGFADDESYFRVQGLNTNGTRNPDYPVLLDVDNLADYMVLILYTGNLDSPISNFGSNTITNNWFGIRDRSGDEGFRFFIHDAEWTLFDLNRNRLGPWPAGDEFLQSNPQWLHQQLMENDEYRLRFADRAHKHLFNDGALTPASSLARIQARIDQIDLAIIAESARWGDTHRSVPYTKADWLTEISRIKEDHIPERTQVLIEQLQNAELSDDSRAPLYPLVDAPVFDQHGGPITADYELTITGPGDIYYTTDGTDPRQQPATVQLETLVTTGAGVKIFVPVDDALGMDWTTPSFVDDAWFDATTGIGFQRFGTTFENSIATNIEAQMYSVNASVYTRIDFQIEDPSHWDVLNLLVKYDDGFVAYLNGTEVARQNAPESLQWDSRSTASRPSSAAVKFDVFNIAESTDLLQSGDNVLAIHGLNSNPTGFNYLLVPELQAGTTTDTGAAPTSTQFSVPIQLSNNTVVKARLLSGGTWSALNEATFVEDSLPVAISEIMYHPLDPSFQEREAGFTNDDDFEFIEIINRSSTESIDMQGVSFSQGIDFTFPQMLLDPGQRVVVVRDEAAFRERYGDIDVVGQNDGDGLLVAGVYEGSLDNGGEQITLTDGLGRTLFTTVYSDAQIWPQAADGNGPSLEMIDPSSTDVETNSKYYSWRSSREVHGTPSSAGAGPLGIVINEILANTDDSPTLSDSIELHNTMSTNIDIGGWYLSDSGNDLLKFEVPTPTIVPPGGYVVFDESDFNVDPVNGFALSGQSGDNVWLVIPNDTGEVDTFVDDVHFGASTSLESIGREPNGGGVLAPMGRTTLGADNNEPRVGPLVFSEIHYNPGIPAPEALALYPNLSPKDIEFVEIHNPSMSEVDLTDWRIRGDVDLEFDAETTIYAGEAVVVVSFDPNHVDNRAKVDAFVTHHQTDDNIRLIGGYEGNLDDDGARVELQRAEYPDPLQPLLVAHIVEDQVSYDDLVPWDVSADGRGASLQRAASVFYGNAASSWIAEDPTPGNVHLFVNQTGDLNGDTLVDQSDIDALHNAINAGSSVLYYDLDGNQTVDKADVTQLVENVLATFTGDANLDGKVDVVDLNLLGVNWKRSNGASWSDGDFNGDGNVDAADLNSIGINWRRGVAVAAAQDRVPRAPLAAPPAAIVDSILGASLNGPKLWLPDWTEIDIGVEREFNGIAAGWVAQLEMGDNTGGVEETSPYKPMVIARKSSLGWEKGTRVLLLDDDKGNTWVMKGFQLGLKPKHTYEEFVSAGAKMFKKLPKGWKVRVKELEKDLVERPKNGRATIMPDEHINVYDKTGPGMSNYKP